MSSDESTSRGDAPPQLRPVDPEGSTPELPEGYGPMWPPGEDAVFEPAPPRPPHPNFGFAVLWCGAFFLVTQGLALAPALVVGAIVYVIEAVRGNTDAQDTAVVMKKVEHAAVMAAVVASQVLGICF